MDRTDATDTRLWAVIAAHSGTAATLLCAGAISLFVSLSACGGEPKRNVHSTPEPDTARSGSVVPPLLAPAAPPSSRTPIDGAACIVLRGELAEQTTSVEGVLTKAHGDTDVSPFVLRLARPRCIVGLEHARFVTEVYVASTGADLRPLVDASLRITGDAIAGKTDLGGPAVLILAKDFERILPASHEP